MMQKKRAVFPANENGERHSDEAFAGQSYQLLAGQVDFCDLARTTEAHVAGRREVTKIGVSLGGVFELVHMFTRIGGGPVVATTNSRLNRRCRTKATSRT